MVDIVIDKSIVQKYGAEALVSQTRAETENGPLSLTASAACAQRSYASYDERGITSLKTEVTCSSSSPCVHCSATARKLSKANFGMVCLLDALQDRHRI